MKANTSTPALNGFLAAALLLLLMVLTACNQRGTTNTGTIATTSPASSPTPTPTPPLPYFHTPDFSPIWPSETGQDPDTLHRVPAFSFLNQDGQEVSNATFKGKIYVANFFFTSCPGICPRMTDNMQRLQQAFMDHDKVLLLSHSVTPWMDSVSVLKNYAGRKGIQSGKWHLVTGPKAEIYTIARQGYFAEKEIGLKRGEDGFVHTEHFLLADHEGHLRGIYNGTLELEIQRLTEDLNTLLQELTPG